MIERLEVVNLLRGIASGEQPITMIGPSWDDVYIGDAQFVAGSYTVILFNHCDSLDYIDHIGHVDGRIGNYDDWSVDDGANPLWLLANDEHFRLEAILKAAPGQPPDRAVAEFYRILSAL